MVINRTRKDQSNPLHNRNGSSMNISPFMREIINKARSELNERTQIDYIQTDVVMFGLYLLMQELDMEIPAELSNPKLYEPYPMEEK